STRTAGAVTVTSGSESWLSWAAAPVTDAIIAAITIAHILLGTACMIILSMAERPVANGRRKLLVGTAHHGSSRGGARRGAGGGEAALGFVIEVRRQRAAFQHV